MWLSNLAFYWLQTCWNTMPPVCRGPFLAPYFWVLRVVQVLVPWVCFFMYFGPLVAVVCMFGAAVAKMWSMGTQPKLMLQTIFRFQGGLVTIGNYLWWLLLGEDTFVMPVQTSEPPPPLKEGITVDPSSQLATATFPASQLPMHLSCMANHVTSFAYPPAAPNLLLFTVCWVGVALAFTALPRRV